MTPKVKHQVLKCGQNITCQTYKAISQSASNHVYNVAVPSLETIISSEVLWKSPVTLNNHDRRQTNWYICVQLRRHRRPRYEGSGIGRFLLFIKRISRMRSLGTRARHGGPRPRWLC
ncbi:MAG: phage major capsid domain-containing protein, partial [Candidatus Fonsibacter sp.]